MIRPGIPTLSSILAVTGLLLLAVAPASRAQEEAQTETTTDHKERTVMKALQHVEAADLLGVLSLIDVGVKVAEKENVLVIRGRPEVIDTALQIVDNLDRPLAGIALKTYILLGAKGGEPSLDVPEVVGDAARQMQELFGYDRVHLLDTLFVRATNFSRIGLQGGSSALESLLEPQRLAYSFEVGKARLIRGDDGPSVRLEELKFETRIVGEQGSDAALLTDVEIREGQTVVVGKAGPKGHDEAIILVMAVDIED